MGGNNDVENLLLAVPKKGRLYEHVINLLKGAGLEYHRPHRMDIAKCTNLPATIVFLPAADIATYVGEGNVDIGITGRDIVKESGTKVIELEELGFGKCTLALQVPVASNIKDPSELAGKRIVTSFPKIAEEFFRPFELQTCRTKIKYVSGSVEAACGLGLADGIVDLVETGTTMKAAGLEIVSTILKTECLLISNPHTQNAYLVDKLRQRIRGYLAAQKYKMISYNISRERMALAIQITPGRKAPTINPLDKDGYVAISAMALKKDIADIMDRLTEIGASDIFSYSLNNCRV